MADAAADVGSDNGLWADDDDQEIPTKDEILQILVDLKGSRRSTLKGEHATNLRELYDVIQKYRAAGPNEDDDDEHVQVWDEFELAYDLDAEPFTSISSFELPPSPAPSSPDKLTVPSLSEPSMPSSQVTTPAQSLNVPASSSASGATRTISPLPSRPIPNNVAPVVRVPLLPIPTSLNPATYCLPLALISAPPPTPPATTDFTSASEQQYNPPLETRSPRIPLPLVSHYARGMYPLPTLPADAAKKAASKAKKKGSSSASAMGGSNGAGGPSMPQPPADLYKWSATVHANPLSVMVRSAKKCLGSADWETAYNELRFNRAMERVESLKAEGRWSFRQPKKQKGPPLAKSHWDWVLEEMKWLQTDFKEERRWKVALAYEMSQWVLDWHDATDKSDVCVRVGTRKFSGLPAATDVDGDAQMDGGEEDGFGVGVSEEREEEGDDAAKVKTDGRPEPDGLDATSAKLVADSATANDTVIADEAPVDNLSATVEAQAAVEEALDQMEDKMTDAARDEGDDPLHLAASSVKEADPNAAAEEDADADGDAEVDADGDAEVEMLDIPELDQAGPSTNNPLPSIKAEVVLGEIVPPELPVEDVKPLADSKTANNDPLNLPASVNGASTATLKSGSSNPTLTAPDAALDTAEVDVEARVRTARETLLHMSSTSLIFDLASFSLPTAPSVGPVEGEAVPEDDGASSLHQSASTLDSHIFADLFGDLAAYTMPLPLSDHAIQNGRLDRRIDDATVAGGKIAHTSRLLDIKPVLISTLQPGKRKKGDEWEDLGDLWGANEKGDYGEPRGEVFTGGTALFARKKVRESVSTPSCSKPHQPRNFEIRLAATIWQNDDDTILQKLCNEFPYNWQLISDAFNTSRRTLSIDRRSPWDCFQRWNKKWNPHPEKEADKRDGPTSEPGMLDDKGTESGPSSPGGSTKKGAASKMQPAILDPKFEGSKKKLRHAKLYDAMRKTAKRRDLSNRKPNLKEPRRVLTAHESHNQYITSRVGGPTPADLSAHKYDKDMALAAAQRKHHEERQEQYRRYQLQQAAAQQAALANAQQQNPGQPRQNGSGTPPAGPPFQNGQRPPGNYQNGGPPTPQQQHQQLTPQQQQQMQARMAAALAAGQPIPNGGGPGASPGMSQQLQLLQAARQANQGGRQPTPQQLRQMQAAQQQQQQQNGGGEQRKSSPNMMGSPSMQAGQISRPPSAAAMGQMLQMARGDTPAEIAQSLVATVPAEIAATINKTIVINGHQVTPALVQQALQNKARAEAAGAGAALAKATGGTA